MTFAAMWMDLEIIIESEVKSDKDKYEITNMSNLTKIIQKNLQNRKTQRF